MTLKSSVWKVAVNMSYMAVSINLIRKSLYRRLTLIKSSRFSVGYPTRPRSEWSLISYIIQPASKFSKRKASVWVCHVYFRAKSKTSVFATVGIWVTFSVVLNFLLLGWTPWMGFQNEQLMCFHNRQKRHGHSWACCYSNTICKCDGRNRLFHFFSVRRILKIVLP